MHSVVTGLLLSVLPSVLGASHMVNVGPGGKTVFDPPFVNADPGDTVHFVFNPKNHTATQSSFDQPCVPLDPGFNSGFIPVTSDAAEHPHVEFNVVDQSPKWFYCQQSTHCGQGMVFAVNPPPEPDPHSFEAFRGRAIALNGTSTSATAPPAAETSFTTPPAPAWESATATVTLGSSTWTTTYTSYEGTPPPTPAAEPINHEIIVGKDGQNVFSPANITAKIGDTVTFTFNPKNHTVTQSSFLKPCTPLAQSSTSGQIGFDSGFTPVAANATDFPSFNLTVETTEPIWGFCRQGNHCVSGMVFAINAVETGPNNFASFVELAKRSNDTSSTPSGSASGSGANPAPTSGAVEKAMIPYAVAVGLGIAALFFS